jgi:hypothetical protein
MCSNIYKGEELRDIMEKRGQTEVGLGTFLLIVVGVIGLVLVGLFVYNSWSKINQIGDLAPEDRTLYKTGCEQAVNIGVAGYCEDFKKVKIGKQSQYMNCEHMNGAYGLEVDASSVGGCSDNVVSNYCTFLNTTKVLNNKTNPWVLINGKNCTYESNLVD